MRPPEFWWNPPNRPGWQSVALIPFAAAYAHMTSRRVARQRSAPKAAVPVICVGNVNAGGTGKTPTVIALATMLSDMERTVHVVSRGYRGRLDGPVAVDPSRHTSAETGDEPLLISAFARTWVARDRAAGIAAATEEGADVVVLDDGYQNPNVNPDFGIVVVDAVAGFGNGRVIPAGPLREPAETGFARADHALIIGSPGARAEFAARWHHVLPEARSEASLEPLPTGIALSGLPVFAFAGIGRPAKFFETLESLGAEIVAARALDDHQDLSPALLARMERDARDLGAHLVTTEKDAVRLAPEWRRKVITVPVRLKLEDPEPLRRAISACLRSRP